MSYTCFLVVFQASFITLLNQTKRFLYDQYTTYMVNRPLQHIPYDAHDALFLVTKQIKNVKYSVLLSATMNRSIPMPKQLS